MAETEPRRQRGKRIRVSHQVLTDSVGRGGRKRTPFLCEAFLRGGYWRNTKDVMIPPPTADQG